MPGTLIDPPPGGEARPTVIDDPAQAPDAAAGEAPAVKAGDAPDPGEAVRARTTRVVTTCRGSQYGGGVACSMPVAR